MVELIQRGIAKRLSQEFEENYSIYTECVSQGFCEPCFFIDCIRTERSQVMGYRYHSRNIFDIRCYPQGQNEKEECNTVAERLYDVLRVIPVENGSIRGTGMYAEVIDGVLHFIVNYNTFLWEVPEKNPNMKQLNINSEVK